jgi:hypothetical protein
MQWCLLNFTRTCSTGHHSAANAWEGVEQVTYRRCVRAGTELYIMLVRVTCVLWHPLSLGMQGMRSYLLAGLLYPTVGLAAECSNPQSPYQWVVMQASAMSESISKSGPQ